jgi:glycosidase
MNQELYKSNNRFSRKLLVFMAALIFTIAAVIYGTLRFSAVSLATSPQDSDVTNKASFSTDVIYQIVTDRFYDGDSTNNPTGAVFNTSDLTKYHGGDWQGIIDKIEDGYLTGLGVTALWISSPVKNITVIDGSNDNASYHGYWGKDYFQTNSAFGSLSDFAELISVAHANGIKIVIDFVPNHTSTAVYGEDGALYRDGSLISTYSNDSQGIFNHESAWSSYTTLENCIYYSIWGLSDLNQQNSTVDTYMKDAINMWINLGVDGIRVDAVKHMSFGWQKNWLSSIYSNQGVFTFGEWYYGGTTNDAEFTNFTNNSGMSLLDFRFANALRNALGSKTGSMTDLYSVITSTSTDFNEVNDQVTFMDSHDMSRFMTLSGSNSRAVENAYVILLTSRGVPNIYYGTEQYLTGSADPYNRGDMTSFSTSSTAYQTISRIAPLRKSNPALAYGTTVERWINSDVIIYERQFGSSVVLTAVNRSSSTGYDITGLYTNLPAGTYSDVLQGLLGGNSITVASNKSVTTFNLAAGESAVWQYTAASESAPLIGNVDPNVGKAGNVITITGEGFGTSTGTIKFGTTSATVNSWSDTIIKVTVPNVTPGSYKIYVTTSSSVTSAAYDGYEVLTGAQVSVRFKVNNATTSWGTNVYLVGSCYELGNWDTSKAIGPIYNATSTIGVYPTWFMDVNVPAGTTIEYKFIKKDSSGNVTWESGSNHTVTTPASGTSTVTVNWQ